MLERFRMYAQFGNKQQQQVRAADEKNVVWIFRLSRKGTDPVRCQQARNVPGSTPVLIDQNPTTGLDSTNRPYMNPVGYPPQGMLSMLCSLPIGIGSVMQALTQV